MERDPMHLIADGLGPDKTALYIGDADAAANIEQLHQLGIVAVLNCAVNLNVNYAAPDVVKNRHHAAYGPGTLRTYKLGLIDGPGNTVGQLIAGYYLLKSAFEQRMPDTPSYPLPSAGNVLIHCRGGRSRSVIIAALFLHRECSDRFVTLETAIDHIRQQRQLHPSEWHETPKPMLIELAMEAIDALNQWH
ncbi:MAG: dual specificity protein phosphatase family protein [Saccharospirillum sp.]|nr:dual specificity protein phosphatase family protein [Saccharospirillum sp.]